MLMLARPSSLPSKQILVQLSTLRSEINQRTTARNGNQTQDGRHRHGMMLNSIHLNWPHVQGLFPGCVGESAVENRRHAGEDKDDSNDFQGSASCFLCRCPSVNRSASTRQRCGTSKRRSGPERDSGSCNDFANKAIQTSDSPTNLGASA